MLACFLKVADTLLISSMLILQLINYSAVRSSLDSDWSEGFDSILCNGGSDGRFSAACQVAGFIVMRLIIR